MELYKANEDVMNTMRDLIAKHHPHLAGCDTEIAVLFREKASVVGGNVCLGKTSKAPPLVALLSDVSYKFIITLAADEWSNLEENQKVALLDHHLCACRAEEDEEHNMKYWVQPPDVNFYKGEIERHGFWRTGGDPAPTEVINSLFGQEQESAEG